MPTNMHAHSHAQVFIAGQGAGVDARVLAEANWLFSLIGQVSHAPPCLESSGYFLFLWPFSLVFKCILHCCTWRVA
eukprot:1159717-Pelagomonas_calceolata.AAC.9